MLSTTFLIIHLLYQPCGKPSAALYIVISVVCGTRSVRVEYVGKAAVSLVTSEGSLLTGSAAKELGMAAAGVEL